MKYFAKHMSNIKNSPGSWDSNAMVVFEQSDDGTEKEVGSYVRNYNGHGEDTFHAFKQKGKWYALYSKDYTSTRVMSLPDCKDIGGEERNAYGFCPTGYYVPNKEDLSYWDPVRIYKGKKNSEDDAYWEKLAIDLKCHEKPGSNFNAVEDAKKKRQWQRDEEEAYSKIEDDYVGQFGFISGCFWGDDSSWKLQYLDLSKISEGIIKREDKWGYWELPSGKTLKECLDFEEFNLPSFTQLKALKEETIPVLDRNWHNYNVGDVFWFNDDSIFNGLRIKVKEIQQDDVLCEIIYSNNKVKETEIFIGGHLFQYAKKNKPETKMQVLSRRIKYLIQGVI